MGRSAMIRAAAMTVTLLTLAGCSGQTGPQLTAPDALAQAGFTTVYNIITGFEGDRIDDPGSEYHGKHLRNGWKNAALPWGYDFHPDLMWIEKH